jgi:hypothetical protein
VPDRIEIVSHKKRQVEVAPVMPAKPVPAIDVSEDLTITHRHVKYEKEWRMILNFNGATCKTGKDNTGTDILLFAIPPDCLISV